LPFFTNVGLKRIIKFQEHFLRAFKGTIFFFVVCTKTMHESLSLLHVLLVVIQDFLRSWWCLTAFDIDACLDAKPIIPILEEDHEVEGGNDDSNGEEPDDNRPRPSTALTVDLMLPDHTGWGRWTYKLQPSVKEHFLCLGWNLLGDLFSKLEALHALLFALH